MIQQAIAKINTEMQKAPNDTFLEAIGQHVIDAITTEANAEAVMNERKTLAGAVKEVTDAARKQAVNGRTAMRDDAVFGIVDKYFGITDAPQSVAPANKAVAVNITDFF